uniref:Saposin B-type domain-containing protein n=1 Tax=Calidris pygmaea TaxID=425635 RepID=A0A8C3JVL7_9CHAR
GALGGTGVALVGTGPALGGTGIALGGSGGHWGCTCDSDWETALRCGALGHCLRREWAPPGTVRAPSCPKPPHVPIAPHADVEGFLWRECAALPVPTMVSPCQNLVHLGTSIGFYGGTSVGIHMGISVGTPVAITTGVPGVTSMATARAGAPAPPSVGAPPLVSRVNAHPQVAAREALPVPLPLCWLCRTFLTRAEAAVPKEAVAAAAAGLCRALPAVVAGACQCLAQRYAVLALEGVLGRLAPRLLCHLLLACRSEDTHRLLSPPGAPPEDPAAPKAACAGSETPPRYFQAPPRRLHTLPPRCFQTPLRLSLSPLRCFQSPPRCFQTPPRSLQVPPRCLQASPDASKPPPGHRERQTGTQAPTRGFSSLT